MKERERVSRRERYIESRRERAREKERERDEQDKKEREMERESGRGRVREKERLFEKRSEMCRFHLLRFLLEISLHAERSWVSREHCT